MGGWCDDCVIMKGFGLDSKGAWSSRGGLYFCCWWLVEDERDWVMVKGFLLVAVSFAKAQRMFY